MSKYRSPSINSKYYIPKEVFLTVVHYCKQYPLWVAELNTMTQSTGIRYDQDHVKSSPAKDGLANLAIRRAAISKKKDQVDHVAKHVAGDLSGWIIQGVCYGLTYYQLMQRGIPCGKDLYYKLRRMFYLEMAKRI